MSNKTDCKPTKYSEQKPRQPCQSQRKTILTDSPAHFRRRIAAGRLRNMIGSKNGARSQPMSHVRLTLPHSVLSCSCPDHRIPVTLQSDSHWSQRQPIFCIRRPGASAFIFYVKPTRASDHTEHKANRCPTQSTKDAPDYHGLSGRKALLRATPLINCLLCRRPHIAITARRCRLISLSMHYHSRTSRVDWSATGITDIPYMVNNSFLKRPLRG